MINSTDNQLTFNFGRYYLPHPQTLQSTR